ncbi:squamous cell carcinoma antigen recognized by T-cells 3-like [Contarinia nasturtii]|uniref:squamous cell carcinoma antigen recognized by T-cells 3-like n=1 Tax=Contarinia nasturtii TaxID=265458 RepID=UPI0012D49FBB|nr:squamous cell carcinoma antigen recognized by T-cells 3-like [Contarinia nasturtii]
MSDQEDLSDQEMDVDDQDTDEVDEDLSPDSGDSDIDAEVQLYENYAKILSQISTASYVYDYYVELVTVAHQLNDLDKIRESSELFSTQFPLAPEIWTKWLQIELTIATSENELKRVEGLFKRALGDYFSVTVGGLHAQLAVKMLNPQETWDEILATYTLDCMEGSTFFKDWRNYYIKHVPESPEKVKKLLEVFTYELSIPLAGIQEAYAEFCEFVDKYNEEVEWEKINETYHKSKDNLYEILTFEQQLVDLDDKEHHKRASIYLDYIDKCKSFKSDRMVQILYERMVTACCLSASTWIKYVKYLKNRETVPDVSEKSLIFKQTALDVLTRALRNCTWSAELYVEKMRLSEKAGIAKSDVTEIAQQAFEATNNDVKGHLNVWMEYLSFINRNTNVTDEKEVEILRKTMELGQNSLATREADAHNEFDQLCARIEYGALKNGDKGFQYYDLAIKNNLNQNKATLWIDFAHLELNRGVDAARKIYRRAIKVKNIDDFDAVMSAWKIFEYAYGTLDQICDCNEMCAKIIENYNKHYAIKAKVQKRKPETENDSKVVQKKQKTFDDRAPKPVKKVEVKKPEPKQPEIKQQEMGQENKPDFGEKDDVSIFLSNLAFDISKEQIIAAFPELNIKDVTMVIGPGGRSKGYGYAELGNPSEVEKAIKFDRRPIGGRPVFIKKVLRDKNIRSTFKYSEGKESNKIFIKGLPFNTTQDELQILFGTFGKIKDTRLVTKKDGKFKGIAFIDFESDTAANKAVETMNSFDLRGFTIIVAISDPPPKSTDNARPMNFNSNTLPSLRGPRSDAKPRLTFIPTSVQRNVAKPSTSSNGTTGTEPTTSKSNDYFRQLLNKKMAISEQKRLFIGNLPPDIQEHELKQEFAYYGAVNKVEIKTKKTPDSDEVQTTFAFITIGLDDRTLRQCLQEFKEQKYRGRQLQVTVARENFLEKLKREREEAAQFKEKKNESTQIQVETVKAVLPTLSTGDSSSSESSSSDESSEDESPSQQNKSIAQQNGSKKFKSSSESSDSESDSNKNEDNLVLKKKSKMFVENGKIKIDRSVSSGEAIHIIESKAQKTNKRELDEKSKKADQKRMESLNKMKNSYNEQKLAIKKALAGVDSGKKSNKIVFEDDDDDETPISSQSTKSINQTKSKENKSMEKKRNLFDDADDSDNEQGYEGNFEIKHQFEGKKGEKLRRLQDRFQGDSRFKMDSKFLEGESDESENDEATAKQNGEEATTKSSDDIETNEFDERQWQLNILESVIGKKVASKTSKEKKAPPSMLRFDPTRAEHTKFIEPKVKKRKSKAIAEPESKRLKTEDEYVEKETEKSEPIVSMEHFYEVRGDLKKSLGSGGFSLLSMFNRPAENTDATTTTTPSKPYEEKLIAKNGVKFLADFDPFKYDSSGDEADNDKKESTTVPKPDGEKSGLKYESFFTLSSADERVSEGMTFFAAPEPIENQETNTADYDDAQRQELKNIVKRKIKKSIQNALPRNAKPNKRFKRFAKNL